MLGGIKRSESKAIAKAQQEDMYTPERCAKEKGHIIPEELKGCARNVGEFYSTKRSSDKGNGIPIGHLFDGGYANRRKDRKAQPTSCSMTPYSYERVSDIASFPARDKMYIGYGSYDRIAYFNRQEKDEIEYVLYLYRNPCNQDGVLGIIEPYEGDRETRVFFLSPEQIKRKQENEKNKREFWKNLGSEYTNMSGKEFAEQNGTSIIRHTGTMDDFSKKIGGILGIVKTTRKDPQHGNLRSIRTKLGLMGKKECKGIIEGVTLNGFSAAGKAMESVIGKDVGTKEVPGHG